jgi:hypothetical protein
MIVKFTLFLFTSTSIMNALEREPVEFTYGAAREERYHQI